MDMSKLHAMLTTPTAQLQRDALTCDNAQLAKAMQCVAEAQQCLMAGDRPRAQQYIDAAKRAYIRSQSEIALLAEIRRTAKAIEAQGTAVVLVEGDRKIVATNPTNTVHTFDWKWDIR